MTERQHLLATAVLAEQVERYEEMAEFMKKVTMMEESLNTEERNLLSVAYKNRVGSRRMALRVVCSIEKKVEMDNNDKKIRITKMYREEIAEELNKVCKEFLELVEKHLIPKAPNPEASVFALKLQGDYYRYLAEVQLAKLTVDDVTIVVKNAAEAYAKAMDIAKEELKPTNPVRLGLALNFSVFHYEIAKNKQKACQLAKEAFDQAVENLSSVGDDNYKDTSLVIQLLRDNLTLWTTEMKDDSTC